MDYTSGAKALYSLKTEIALQGKIGEIMAAKFRVVLHQGDVDNRIVDESFIAESVEQILRCKPDDVVHVEAMKVCDIGPDYVEEADVWLELCSMRENLAEASAMGSEAVAVDTVAQLKALNGLTAHLSRN